MNLQIDANVCVQTQKIYPEARESSLTIEPTAQTSAKLNNGGNLGKAKPVGTIALCTSPSRWIKR